MKLRCKQVPILHGSPAHSPVRDSSTGYAKKSWLLHCNNGKEGALSELLPQYLCWGDVTTAALRGTASSWVARPLPRQGQLSGYVDSSPTTTIPAPCLHPLYSALSAVPTFTSELSGEASTPSNTSSELCSSCWQSLGGFQQRSPWTCWSLHCSAPQGEKVSGKMKKSTNYTKKFRGWK